MRSLGLGALGLLTLLCLPPRAAHADFITAPAYVHVGDATPFDYQIRDDVLASTPVLLPTGVQFLGGSVLFDPNGPATPGTASVGVSGFVPDVSAAFGYTAPGVYRATVGGAVQVQVSSSIGALTTSYTFDPSQYSPFVVVVPLGDPIPTNSLLTGPTHASIGVDAIFQASLSDLIAKFIAQEQPLFPGLTFSRIDSVGLTLDPGGPSSTGSQAWQSKTDPAFTTSYTGPGFFYPALTGTIDAEFRQCVSVLCQSPFPLTIDVSETHLIAIQPETVPEPSAGLLLAVSGVALGIGRSALGGRRRAASRLRARPR